jgi:hypothetical protein
MKKNRYHIVKKVIHDVNLYSLTEKYWIDALKNLVSWTGQTGLEPSVGTIVKNVTGSLPTGYYQWSGTQWNTYTGKTQNDYEILLPLESTVDEMGVMVGFDGDIQQVDQIVNFSYTQNNNILTIYGTTNPEKLRTIVEQTFTIDWGDGTTSSNFPINQGVLGTNLPSTSHTYTYSTTTGFTVSISLNTPWTQQKVSKYVTFPKFDGTIQNPLGTFSGFTIPYTTGTTGSQNYLNNLDYTNNTGSTAFTYMSFGKSRLNELKKYGGTGYTQVLTSGSITGSTGVVKYTGYTIDNLIYRDYSDGYTMITGHTSGFTREDVVNYAITRNEHFIGFVEDPTVYSDIFVERGKQGVMEKNFRLGEIDNVGELDIYGNGYFKIKKQ